MKGRGRRGRTFGSPLGVNVRLLFFSRERKVFVSVVRLSSRTLRQGSAS